MSTPDRELEPAEALRAELEAEREAELEAEVGAATGATGDAERDSIAEADVEAAGPELSLAFSPRQILGGFALLAAILVWIFRRRKR
jgi:hypothetical protein